MSNINNICIFMMTDYGTSNGKGLEAQSITESLLELNFNVNCFVRDSKNNKNASNVNFLGNMPYRFLSFFERYVSKKIKARYLQEKMFDYFCARKLKKILRKENKLAIYAVPRMLKTCEVAKKNNVLIIIHAVELSAYYNEATLKKIYGSGCSFPNVWDLSLLELSKATQPYANYMIAHTEFSKKSYVASGFDAERIFITPMGFSPKHHVSVKSFPNTGIVKFLFVGNITKAKGVHKLLEAWSGLTNPEIELHICGTLYEDIKEDFQESLIRHSNIKYHGYVNPQDLYATCDVFIFPSYLESFGKVIVEAGANGLAILCNRDVAVGCFDSEKNPCGLTFDSDSTSTIIAAMNHLLNHRGKIQMYGMNAKEFYSKLTWSEFGSSSASIIKHILTEAH